MDTLTIELPEQLVQQIQAQKISSQRLESVIIRLVEAYLREIKEASKTTESTWTDSEEFARRVIANNQALFEELSRR